MVAVPVEAQINPKENESSLRILSSVLTQFTFPLPLRIALRQVCIFGSKSHSRILHCFSFILKIKPQDDHCRADNKIARAELPTCHCYSLQERHQYIFRIFIQILSQILFWDSVFTHQLFFHFNLVLLGLKAPLKVFCRPERRKWCYFISQILSFAQPILCQLVCTTRMYT